MPESGALVVIDLCSGLGGFSQAFLDRGHRVTRYDNDPRFEAIPNTVIEDVFNLTAEDLREADIVLASPPCQVFSCAAAWRYWYNGRPKEDRREHVENQIALVKHIVKIIHGADPPYWVLENPRGLLRKVLGPPAVTTFWAAWGAPYLKPTDLWGKIPAIDWRIPRKWVSDTHGRHRGVQETVQQIRERYKAMRLEGMGSLAIWSRQRRQHSQDVREQYKPLIPLDADGPALRSLIPYQFSLALCHAVENDLGGQSSLVDYLNPPPDNRGEKQCSTLRSSSSLKRKAACVTGTP
ncbi:MAG: hypothetical protein DRH24_17720 [Deltaproteobacteria bacterium]|nr:MAG: hypothetical protein DRH24_17720 [Deltaproteobacteria bacterium]